MSIGGWELGDPGTPVPDTSNDIYTVDLPFIGKFDAAVVVYSIPYRKQGAMGYNLPTSAQWLSSYWYVLFIILLVLAIVIAVVVLNSVRLYQRKVNHHAPKERVTAGAGLGLVVMSVAGSFRKKGTDPMSGSTKGDATPCGMTGLSRDGPVEVPAYKEKDLV